MPRDDRDEHVERGGEVCGGREPQSRQQREPRRERPEHRAERVERVQARECRADALALDVRDEHRQRRAHECGRRQQERDQQREPRACEREALATERAIELPDERIARAQERQQRHAEDADPEFEQRVGPRAPPAARERHTEHPRTEREAAEERGHDRGHRVQRAAHDIGELLRPDDLVQEAGGAGGEEAQRGPCGERTGAGTTSGSGHTLDTNGRRRAVEHPARRRSL
jgi:hypothetical protein